MDIAEICLVATDDERVARAVSEAGGEVVLTSPAHSTGTERVAEVASQERFSSFDTVVNVQGDEPFISEEAVRGAADIVGTGRFPLGTSAARAGSDILDSPAIVKVIADDSGRALYFSRAPIPYLRDQRDAPLRASRTLQHIGVYAYRLDALARWAELPPHPLEEIERLEQLRPLAAGIPMGVAVTEEVPGIGIDTEEDLINANARWEMLTAGAAG